MQPFQDARLLFVPIPTIGLLHSIVHPIPTASIPATAVCPTAIRATSNMFAPYVNIKILYNKKRQERLVAQLFII
jgi:hypothetical protein